MSVHSPVRKVIVGTEARGVYSAPRARSSADRALASGVRGRRFESCRAYQKASSAYPGQQQISRKSNKKWVSFVVSRPAISINISSQFVVAVKTEL